jgi:hypothetical protein
VRHHFLLRGSLRLAAVGAVALLGGARQARAQYLSSIEKHLREIQGLLADATSKNEALRMSCIEDKLKKTQVILGAGKTIKRDWALGQQNPGFAKRSLDRLIELQLYATIYDEEAHACVDSRTVAFSLQVQVDKRVPQLPPWGTPPVDRSPTFERPPLGSPF